MEFKLSLLLVLAATSFTNAFNTLIPDGKRLVYEYRAMVDAGTHFPTAYSSSFGLVGTLNIEPDGNSTLMQFSDLKYKLRNGDMVDWYDVEGKEMPLVNGTEDFLKPFKVVHDESGNGLGIVAESKLEYVLNFQKAIGSIMQLNMKKINLDAKKIQVFKSVENSIYGRGDVSYTLFPRDDHLSIMKVLQINGDSIYQNLITNFNPCKCSAKYQSPLSRDSQKTYKIATVDSHKVIKDIYAEGGTFYNPFHGISESFGIYVNQTMELLSIETPDKKIEVTDQKLLDFSYYLSDLSPESPERITHERRAWNMDKLLETLEKMFKDSFKYLKDFHLKISMDDIKKGHVLNDIKRLMFDLDLPSIEKLTENVLKIETDKFKELPQIYLQMLPVIGSQPSIKHIMKMIRQKKFEEHVALDMLQEIPNHVASPNKEFIAEMEEIINWGNEYSLSLRKAGIYCFSRLLHKATYNIYDHLNLSHQSRPSQFMLEHPNAEKHYPSSKYYERYIVEFAKRLKETDDYSTKLLYIQALHNTEMVEILEHLAPIIKGELWDDNYLQIIAAFAVSPIVRYNEDLVFELYWPILADKTQPLSNKAVIYYLILETQPNLSTLMNMHWWLEKEIGNELYSFYYSYLEAVSKTTDPCKQDFRWRANQMLRYSYKPAHGISAFKLVDFRDAKYGFGKALDFYFINSPKSSEMIFKTAVTTYMDSATTNDFKLFIRIYGLEDSIFKQIKLQVTKPDQLFSYESVFNMIKNIPNNKKFNMHVSVTKTGKVIMDYNIDSSNYMQVLKELSFWLGENSKAEEKIVKISYPHTSTVYLATDIGFPSIYQNNIPALSHNDYIMTKETNPQFIKYHIDYIVKLWVHGKTGLSVYNPFADVFQSINKFHSYDFASPIMFDVYINKIQKNLKLSWTRFGNEMEDHIGYRSHVGVMTSFEDDLDNKLVKQCSEVNNNYEVVSKGDDYRQEYTLFEEEIPITGHHHSMVAFDSERYMENTTRSSMFEDYKESVLRSSHTCLQNIFIDYISEQMYQFYQPITLSNGFLYRFKFSTKYPSTQNDLTIRLSTEYKHGEWLLTPATKYSGRLTYVLKNKNDTIVTWDMFGKLDQNSGHTLTNYKLHLTKIKPEQIDLKFCIEGYKKWNEEGVEGNLNISTSYPGTQCHDTPILQINMLGEQLQKQKTNRENYDTCTDVIWSDMDYENSLSCYASYSSIRKYTYRFLGTDTPAEFHKTFHYYLNKLQSYFRKHLMITKDATEKLDENARKMVIEYPMLNEKVINVRIYTKDYDLEMNSLPVAIHPDNLQYPKMLERMYNLGLTQTYIITNTSVLDIDGNAVDYEIGTEYKLCLGDAENDSKHGVFVKQIGATGRIAVKFVHNDQHLEIVPTDELYDFFLNGKKLEAGTYSKARDWMYFNLVESTGYVNILTHHLGINYLYEGQTLKIVIPHTDLELHGSCFKH